MNVMLGILNSNGFQTLIALVVGAFIFIQYRINKRDQVKDAASLIVIELQSAIRNVKNIKKRLNDGVLESDVSVMLSNSWQIHRQLFAKYLDRDEWDTIEEFYNRATLLDDTISYNNQMFRNDVEQIRINKQRAAADFAIDTVNNIKADTDREQIAQIFGSKVGVYDTLYMSKQGDMAYAPNRVVDDARKYIDNLPDILNSSALEKLKNISKKGKI